MFHNKLIRDNILQKIESNGEKAKRHTANEAEFELKLLEKLVEESREVQDSQSLEELQRELADIQEVLDEIIKFYNFSKTDLAQLQTIKRETNGGFTQKIILEETQ